MQGTSLALGNVRLGASGLVNGHTERYPPATRPVHPPNSRHTRESPATSATSSHAGVQLIDAQTRARLVDRGGESQCVQARRGSARGRCAGYFRATSCSGRAIAVQCAPGIRLLAGVAPRRRGRTPDLRLDGQREGDGRRRPSPLRVRSRARAIFRVRPRKSSAPSRDDRLPCARLLQAAHRSYAQRRVRTGHGTASHRHRAGNSTQSHQPMAPRVQGSDHPRRAGVQARA